MKRLMVLAGEVSGDLHASLAIEQFQKRYPELPLEMMGMGGSQLEKVGVNLFQHTATDSKIGHLDNLLSIFRSLSLLSKVKKKMREWRPHLLLLVDSPGFNLRLLPLAKQLGIPALVYFGPSVWIWGAGRARKLIKEEAFVAAVFQPEKDLYQRLGGRVHFVGHPVMDRSLNQERLAQLREELGEGPIIGLLPGSRKRELKTILPVLLATVSSLQEKDPSLNFALPLAPGLYGEDYLDSKMEEAGIHVLEGSSWEVMALSTLVITASGTATLEAAVLQVPMVIVYQASPLTAFIFRRFGVQTVGMPNLLLGEMAVPELIQKDFTRERLVETVLQLLQSPQEREEMRQRLSVVKERVGPPGALDRMAELMKRFL